MVLLDPLVPSVLWVLEHHPARLYRLDRLDLLPLLHLLDLADLVVPENIYHLFHLVVLADQLAPEVQQVPDLRRDLCLPAVPLAPLLHRDLGLLLDLYHP